MTINAKDISRAITLIDDIFETRKATETSVVPVARDNDAIGNAYRSLASKSVYRGQRIAKATRLARKTLAFITTE